MENLYKTTRKRLESEKGMVLVVVMLFLLITSFLALTLLNTSLLETKMSDYYQNKARAFYKAEDILEKREQEIISGKIISPEITEIKNANVCGATFYRITASAKHNTVQSELQSTFAKIAKPDDCTPKPNIKPGRQAFLITH
ncbi:type IV pilus assembly protein PilX [Gammaproteobacteria bacterium]